MLRIGLAPSRNQTVKLWFRAEVQEQTDFEIGGPQIIEQLTLSGRCKELRGLKLNDNTIVHEKVHSLEADLHALVQNLHGVLTRDSVPAHDELVLQGRRVYAFDESEAERVVDVVEGADD